MKTGVNLKYFVNESLCKLFFSFSRTSDPLKLDFFDNFGNSKAFHVVLIQFRAIKLKKVLKLAFRGNCFSDIFTEVEI